jgi:UDP-N-acetylmuramoyl-tripeptide--D-alanyl-D-alanine ligase
MFSIETIHKLHLELKNICTDTRKITPNSIFWALKGANFDGNSYALKALEMGAAYAVVDDASIENNGKIIKVENTLETLQELAKYHRKQLNIPIVAVLGSNGKTTVKELISSVLGVSHSVFSTVGNLNNHIGLPLSILSIDKDKHHFGVLEIGANHQGENRFLLEIAQPDYIVLTNIGKDHLEGFGGFKGVVKAYNEATDFARQYPVKSFVVNKFDYNYSLLNLENLPTLTVGNIDNQADIRLKNLNLRFPYIDVETEEGLKIESNLIGDYQVGNIGIALGVGALLGISIEDVQKGVKNYSPQNMRMQLIKITDTTTIINDCYNANPSSTLEGLNTFSKFEGKLAVVLGDMFELGEESEKEHKSILDYLSTSNFQKNILIGKLYSSLKLKYNTFSFYENIEELTIKDLHEYDYIYLKGSRGMGLEKILEKM